MEINRFVITLIVGGLILLSFLKLSNILKVNRKANIYFGLFLLLWSSFWLDEMLIPKYLEHDLYVSSVIHFLQFLTPAAFYLSVVVYVNPGYRYSKRDVLHIIFPLSFLVFTLYEHKISASTSIVVFTFIFIFNALLYTLLGYYRINRHQKDIEKFSSNKEPIDLNWLKYIIYSFIISALVSMFYTLFTDKPLNVYLNAFFLFVVYLVAYFSIKQKEIYPVGFDVAENILSDDSDAQEVNIKTKLLQDHELATIKDSLLQLMQEDKPYLDSELNLIKLAELLNISGHQLSYVINTGFNENFYYFINKHRVKEAEKLLMNPDNDKWTILAVGFESGFNSKTSFNTIFKKITSYTPSEFRKVRSNL